ncbi:MAG: major facilitator superfamily 1 [Deltaproteobacteria bacterium]|nr:major facilitator superfamily 1 [Deltaproteobacteria bacterium]
MSTASATEPRSRAEPAWGAPSRGRYAVLGFTLVLTAIAYLDRVCIATAAPAIKLDLQLSDVQMGYVFSAFTFAYALFEVPSGWLADRFGARLMLMRIVIWWSAMTAATGLASGFASLFTLRLFFGLGEAGTFPSIARAYARWMPARERGRSFGLAVMTGALGGALTQPLVVVLLEVLSWRRSFAVFGLVGVAWAVAWVWWFRDDPHDHPAVNPAELALIGTAPALVHTGVPWRALARNRSMRALCLMYGGVIYGWYFYLTWLPMYLLRARGFDLHQVGWLAAFPYLGIAAGVLAGGWISDALVRHWGARAARRGPAVIGLPLAAVAVVAAVRTPAPVAAALLLAAAAGLAALAVAPAWAVCLEIGGRHAGVVTGAMNTFGNIGGALSPVVVGLSLERWNSWNLPLFTVAALYLVAAVCWLRIDPTDPIPHT